MKEISVTPHVANFEGYMNSHLARSYISPCKTLIVKHKVKQNTEGNILSNLITATAVFLSRA